MKIIGQIHEKWWRSCALIPAERTNSGSGMLQMIKSTLFKVDYDVYDYRFRSWWQQEWLLLLYLGLLPYQISSRVRAIIFIAILRWSAPIHKITLMSDAKKQLHNCQFYEICIVNRKVDVLRCDTIQIIMNMDFHLLILLLTLVSWMLPLLEVVNLQMWDKIANNDNLYNFH